LLNCAKHILRRANELSSSKDEVREEDLIWGIRSLRQSMLADPNKSYATGFRAAPLIDVAI
jgi:hypothetical protein